MINLIFIKNFISIIYIYSTYYNNSPDLLQLHMKPNIYNTKMLDCSCTDPFT